MKTLSIVSHKGGAGKTSSAVMLAEDLAARGLRVILVDADRQAGAGLLLGIEPGGGGQVQQTRSPRLRYFSCQGLPLRELAGKAKELDGLFDLAVVDTPSLDDPLAKGWLQVSTHVLMTIPVEPVSLKTLDAADLAMDSIRRLNSEVRFVGMLPTQFNEEDSTQRTLMLELKSRRQEDLLAQVIPHDSNLAHRAEQKAERRTEPSERTRKSYSLVSDHLVKTLQLDGAAPAAPSAWSQPKPSAQARPEAERPAPAARPAAPPAAKARAAKPASPLRWVAVAAVLLLILAVGVGLVLGPLARARSASEKPAGKGSSLVNVRKTGR